MNLVVSGSTAIRKGSVFKLAPFFWQTPGIWVRECPLLGQSRSCRRSHLPSQRGRSHHTAAIRSPQISATQGAALCQERPVINVALTCPSTRAWLAVERCVSDQESVLNALLASSRCIFIRWLSTASLTNSTNLGSTNPLSNGLSFQQIDSGGFE